MMRALRFAMTLLLLTLTGNPGKADDQPVMGNAPFVISDKDLPIVKNEALGGSGEAALRLYKYYRKIALDPKSAIYWAQVAAENGDPIGQYTFGLELLELKDEQSETRARYWMRRAADQGNSRARDVLDRLEGHQTTR